MIIEVQSSVPPWTESGVPTVPASPFFPIKPVRRESNLSLFLYRIL